MEEQRFLFDILFEGKRFKVFSNNNFRKTFLRILDDNSLCYATLEEYAKLDKIFNKEDFGIVYNKKIISKIFKPAAIKENGGERKLLYDLNLKNALKTVLATTLAATLVSSQNNMQNEEFVVSNTNPIIEEQQDIVIEEQQDIVIEQDDDGTRWLYKNGNNIYTKNNDEFRQYVENKNPTFNEVREAISKKQNLDPIIVGYLYEYIDILEEKCPDIDLVCFYHNIEKLEFRIETKEELEKQKCSGYFEVINGTIVVGEELNKETIYHEIGHMLNQACIMVNNNYVMRKAQSYVIDEQNNVSCIGTGFSEGLNENFHLEVFDIDNNMDIGIYRDYTDVINLILKTTDIDIIDLLQNDTRYVIEQLKENGIKDAKHIIDLMDSFEAPYNEEELVIANNLRKEIYEIYFEDFCEKKREEGYTEEELYYYLIDTLNYGYIQEKFSFDNIYFSEQKSLYWKVIDQIQYMNRPKDFLMEDFICINLEAPENPIEVYLAKEDENGMISVYDINTQRPVNIDVSYGEFAKTLEENGIIKYDEKKKIKNIITKEELIEYCNTRDGNKLKVNSNEDIKETVQYNSDGSYNIYTKNTGLDFDKYNFFEDSLKTYNIVVYHYDENNNLQEITTKLYNYDNEQNNYNEEITFLPNGDYNQTISYFDKDGVEYESKQIEYKFENTKTTKVNTKTKSGKVNEQISVYDYTVISPYMLDGYLEKGDYVSQTFNGEIVVEKIDDITYIHNHHKERGGSCSGCCKEGYKMQENGRVRYRRDGTKFEFLNRSGEKIEYDKDEKIKCIINSDGQIGYYDYDKNFISYVRNYADTEMVIEAYGNTYKINSNDSISFYENGTIETIEQGRLETYYYRINDPSYYYIENYDDNTYTFYHNDEVLHKVIGPKFDEITSEEDGITRIVLREDGRIIDDIKSENKWLKEEDDER